MQKAWERAIVVGASSGIGEAIARQLALAGTSVALVARRVDRLNALADDLNEGVGHRIAFPVHHDVREWREVDVLFQQITAQLGGVDLVVYASGIMPSVEPDEYPTEADTDAIETNFVGAVAWLNCAAARFTIARAGTIIGISSIAGDRGRATNPVYNATKSALSTYLEALNNRLRRHGVTVLLVKPGLVRTALIQSQRFPNFTLADSNDVARQILKAARSGRRVIYTPRWWRYVARILKLIPGQIMERVRF